ncbi:MAG: ABC transporter permease [Acidobacteriia bacterium]|nr:ABC transporter permease [Terriglobia bacterium]
MILLRLITWPYVRKHRLRSMLTVAGIVLGVALLVAMRTADQSVLQAFHQTVDRIAGKAQLEISSGDTGIPEDVLERVQAVPEVRAAAPAIEAAVESGLPGQGKLLILAVDMTGDRSLRDYDFDGGEEDIIDDPLVFLAQPDSLILTHEFADRNGLRTGSKIDLDTMEGKKAFTVRGILKAGGMAAAFGGNLGIMDIYAAQKVFGRGRRFDRIDVGLQEGLTLEQGQAALRRALGTGLTIEPPSGRGRQFDALLSVYSLAVNVSSLFALLIGMFIIYNSFAIAVTQRRPEIGILRALGATRAQIRWLFLTESAMAGLVGSALGIAAGLAFARSLTGITGQLLENVFGVAQNANTVEIHSWFLLWAGALGIATSTIAGFVPARNAALVEPVQALQKGKYQVLGAGENRVRRWAALGAIAGALLCLALSGYRPLFYAGYVLVLLAGLLLAPTLSLALARMLRVPLRWLRPVEGALAADSLIQAPRRTSATVAALMLSLALVTGTGGVARASFQSIREWMASAFNPDLFVTASETIAEREFRFPAAVGKELEQVPGVDEIQPVRIARIQYRGGPVMIVAVDLAKLGNRVHPMVAAGDAKTMYPVAGQGKGLIVTENLAGLQKIRLGETLELNTPGGPLRLPVVGIIRDYSNQLGTLFVERKTYISNFQDDSVDLFRVYLKPGTTAEQARREIIDRVGRGRRLFVLMNQEVREYVIRLSDQWFGMSYLQVFVAVMVAILGIVNTLTVSIADRRRELGVLRAVGGLRAQIRGTIWMEATAIGLIGLILGAAIGAITLYYELQVIQQDLTGMPLRYEFPLGLTAILVPVILGAAFAAAVLPAENAVRGSLVAALEYE